MPQVTAAAVVSDFAPEYPYPRVGKHHRERRPLQCQSVVALLLGAIPGLDEIEAEVRDDLKVELQKYERLREPPPTLHVESNLHGPAPEHRPVLQQQLVRLHGAGEPG